MIITKTPFRVSFAGGGSDMANFYEQHGGCVLSTSINKYCYLSIHPYFDENATLLKYSENELVTDISKIKHRIFNSVLNEYKVSGVEISSTADVPGGTGLGSSSTFTVGLLNTIACYRGKFMSKGELAAKACDVEINKLGSPIGKQDQYAAAYGGLNFIRFNQDGSVSVEPIVMQPGTYKELEKHLVMFYTGNTRSANSILKEQKKKVGSSPWVFPSATGGPISPDSVLHMLHRVLKRAGLPKVRFHDLRHTFATLALQNGVDIKTVSGMLGHFSAGFTLDTYAHVTSAAQRQAAQTIGNVLTGSLRSSLKCFNPFR